jgi:hypothetical protein
MNIPTVTFNRLARANTASSVGAGLIGISVGILFHDYLLPYFLPLLLLGFVLHSIGMYDSHRIERRNAAERPAWMRVLYVACWIGLGLLAAYSGVRATPAFGAAPVETRQVARIDGIDVFYGVIPAEVIRGHPPEHAKTKMHGGVPRGSGQHHLIVSIFDVKTGRRIEDAQVSARISEPGLAPQSRDLEPMQFAGSTTYGNFFSMSSTGPYRIELTIRPHGRASAQAVFEYRHPRR